jgi:membrane protein involved in colicin uptake
MNWDDPDEVTKAEKRYARSLEISFWFHSLVFAILILTVILAFVFSVLNVLK